MILLFWMNIPFSSATASAAVQEHVNEIVSMTYQYLNMVREEGIQVRSAQRIVEVMSIPFGFMRFHAIPFGSLIQGKEYSCTSQENIQYPTWHDTTTRVIRRTGGNTCPPLVVVLILSPAPPASPFPHEYAIVVLGDESSRKCENLGK